MSDTTDCLLYSQVPEINAAVRAVAHMAMHYCERVQQCERARFGLDAPRKELYQELIQFFAAYDRMRTDQVEYLKSRLIEELKWSVRPPAKKA